MAEFILGDDSILSIWGGISYIPITCLTSNSLSETRNIIESQTKCNAGLIDKKGGSYTYELSFEGQVEDVASGVNAFSWQEIAVYLRNNVNITWRISTGASDGDEYYYGTGIIQDLTNDAPAGDELVTFSGTISGIGKPSTTDPNGG